MNSIRSKHSFIIAAIFMMIITSVLSCSINYIDLESRKAIKKHEIRCSEYLVEEEKLLTDAVRKDNAYKIKRILKQNKKLIDKSFSGERYYSILHYAVNIQKIKAAEALLKSGYNPDVQDQKGNTPLHICVDSETLFYLARIQPEKYTSYVRLLLDYKANSDICNDKLESPLIYSVHFLLLEPIFPMQRVLIEEGHCDINLVDANNCSVLDYAKKKNYKNFEEYLLRIMN